MSTRKKQIGVVLSGCGYLDGTEIHEAVCGLLALDRAGAEVHCFAPDIEFDVVDHRTKKPTGERRNCLTEAARIARGRIQDIAEADVAQLDGLFLPGGFGAAKNLCNFATEGSDCSVHEGVAALLHAVHDAGKPIAAVCIAPALLARLFGSKHPSLTIGDDEGTARELEKLGARHVTCPVDDCVIDRDLKVVTAPAYMFDTWTASIEKGITAAVTALLEMCD
ncbi:MAG: isoprenoid biosynthesis glyoxalase ElbB [Planctomycetes bacterium]|nr:isoprenoid biosynthesis glyoxalase ElbB [Planctomycetota bacterium]